MKIKNLITKILLGALLLGGTANAFTLKSGANIVGGKPRPVVSLNQALYNKGNFRFVGELEKEDAKPFALQGSLTYGKGPNSVTAALKEGIDEASNPFNPAYLYPGVFYGRRFGNFNVSMGGRGYFPKKGEPGYAAALSAGYRWKNLGIEAGFLLPIRNMKFSIKPMISYEFK